LDLKLGRIHFPSDELMRQACRIPKELFNKKVKNISRDTVGDQFGRVHVGKQQIDKIQTRKVKALKSNRDKELGIEDDN
jgi:ribosome production factor 2